MKLSCIRREFPSNGTTWRCVVAYLVVRRPADPEGAFPRVLRPGRSLWRLLVPNTVRVEFEVSTAMPFSISAATRYAVLGSLSARIDTGSRIPSFFLICLYGEFFGESDRSKDNPLAGSSRPATF